MPPGPQGALKGFWEGLERLRRRVAELEAEREKLLARLAHLEALARPGARGGVLSRERALELHGLPSAYWAFLSGRL